ncbi:MAG: hypothetical protein J0H65_05440 [Rhizobiales bacterium]|nr:hypothetical protein [Hyphomicrobiales bacterium]
MKRVIGSLVFLSLAAGGALAQDGGAVIGKQQGVKLVQAECEAVWAKANPSKKDKISAGQAQPFISDVVAANTNGDGSIDQSEFMAACDKGLMKAHGATTGSSTGAEGAGPAAPPAP